MITPTSVRALPNYRLYLEFSDGTKGEVDLSDLAGREVFQAWDNPGFFEKVHIGSHREVRWDDEIELGADSLYLKLTGKTPEELFRKLRREQPHACLPLLRHYHQNVLGRSPTAALPRCLR